MFNVKCIKWTSIYAPGRNWSVEAWREAVEIGGTDEINGINKINGIKTFNYDDLNIKFSLEGVLFDVIYFRSSSFLNFPMHHHAAYEIRYILSDNEVIFVDNERYHLKSGMICLTGPNVWHQQSSLDGEPFCGYTICLDISEAKEARREAPPPGGDQDIICDIFKSKLFWIGEDRHNCGELFEKMADEIERKEPGYFSLVKNYLRELVIKMTRNYIGTSADKPAPYEISVKTVPERRLHLLDTALIQSQPPLNELAVTLGLGVKQTERLFLKFYNKTYAQKKLEVNLRCAAHMLLTTDLTVAQICGETRFRTVGYFYRMFKLYYGKTPAEYKRDAQKAAPDA